MSESLAVIEMKKEKSAKTTNKLFIVDGHAFCFRAYYAIRQLSNSQGEPTNAIYGFVTMLRKLISQFGPDHIAICFDRKEPTFRHKLYDQYKANRSPMPEDLALQMEPIKDYCRACKYTIFEIPGFEADDVFGTLSKQAAEKDYEVYIITGDKDAMQLVTDKVKLLNPHKELVIDRAAVKKKLSGLGPENVIDMMALMGDSSDNIPGVPGVGEKTAIKLISEFGSVENLMGHLEKIKSKRQRELLNDNKDKAALSKELVTIDCDMDLDVDWDALELQEPDKKVLADFYRRYEFRSLLKEVESQQEEQADYAKRTYTCVTDLAKLKKLAADLEKSGAFSFDTETTSPQPMRADLVGMSFCFKEYEAYYVPVASEKHEGPGIALADAVKIFAPVLESSKVKKYGQNIKYDSMVMKRHGVALAGEAFDTMLASYLINPSKFNHNLDDITLEYLGIRKIPTDELIGKGKNQITMDRVPLEKITGYACEDADCVFRLVKILKDKLEENKIVSLFENVEMPLSLVLAEMETNGVYLDLKLLKKMSEETADELEKLTGAIYEEAGEEFNINSTKQLAEIFFEKKNYPTIKKTKTGFSTDVSVLEKLAVTYELPKMILEYREKAKLKSTYLDALPELVNPDTHVIHTSYHQTVTATGRLSSSDPNLQNIPIKTEAGRQIRKAFKSRIKGKDKGFILAADYSQVELRILAHFAGDKNLVKAFSEDKDVHRFTATLLYDVDEDDVTYEMRNVAKTINFSIIYGKTGYGLSQDLGLSIAEANQFIENYFERYVGIREYLDSQKEKARSQGYLTTILGRRAYFPDINSKNMHVRQFAERAAINAPIQGSAADLIKLAMIDIQQQLKKHKLETLMTMQVHDELVFDGPEKELDAVKKIVKQGMENAYELKVPLIADVTVGDSWFKG